MRQYGFFAGDTGEGAGRGDSDESVIDEVNGWECIVRSSDLELLLCGVVDLLNDESLPDVSNHWFRCVEFPNNIVEDGEKVEL